MKVEILKHDMNLYYELWLGEFRQGFYETKEHAEFWAEVILDDWRAGHPTADGIPLQQHLDRIEASYIESALEQADYNRAAAARLLGIKRTTLIDRCKKLGVYENLSN